MDYMLCSFCRVDYDPSEKPANLANSAVLKMLQEEEEAKRNGPRSGECYFSLVHPMHSGIASNWTFQPVVHNGRAASTTTRTFLLHVTKSSMICGMRLVSEMQLQLCARNCTESLRGVFWWRPRLCARRRLSFPLRCVAHIPAHIAEIIAIVPNRCWESRERVCCRQIGETFESVAYKYYLCERNNNDKNNAIGCRFCNAMQIELLGYNGAGEEVLEKRRDSVYVVCTVFE